MKLKLKKGLRLVLPGEVPADAKPVAASESVCAIVPDDFPGFIPKAAVKEGDAVGCGSPLLYDKNHPEIKLVSPQAGRVKAVVRGDRRKIMRVEIEASATDVRVAFGKATTRSEAIDMLASSGLLAMIRQRPYDIVPDPTAPVRDIFVSACNFAPLEVSQFKAFATIFDQADYQAGIEALRLVTDGRVYVAHNAGESFPALSGAEMVAVEGNFPAGNAGVIAANIAPVDKGDTIWTLDLPTLGRIGRLFAKGELESRTIVALAGPEVKSPALLGSVIGTSMASITNGRTSDNGRHLRIISGNPLTGVAVGADGYLRWPYRQVTVIDEGDDVDEFMGWAPLKPAYKGIDARVRGGRRAMILSGEYDRYMPMDILPEYLIKAIISRNIEDMEKLGIYEVAPEDFAAAEYADTSKLPLQQIVREGLDYLRKELE